MDEIIEVFLEEGPIVFKIISLSIAIVFIIADWRIHTKAGEKGWIALIPVYNIYSFYKIVWNARAFWIGLCLEVPIVILSEIFGEDYGNNIWILLIVLVLGLAAIAFTVITNYKAAKAFGHGIGFTIGLSLAYNVFILIISFGKSKYVRNERKNQDEIDARVA